MNLIDFMEKQVELEEGQVRMWTETLRKAQNDLTRARRLLSEAKANEELAQIAARKLNTR